MNGVNVTWQESVPPITEAAGQGYFRIQSDKTSTRMGLDDEHQWPSSGGTLGYHRYGSARPYYGTQSRVSSDGTDGRLMLTSDTSQLFGMTSAGTVFIGGQRVISAFTAPSTLPQRHQWLDSWGTSVTGSGGSVRVTYPGSGFSGIAIPLVSPVDNGANFFHVAVSSSNATGFVVHSWETTAFLAGILFAWRSTGSVAL